MWILSRDSSELAQTGENLESIILYTLQIIRGTRNLRFTSVESPLNPEIYTKHELPGAFKITNHPNTKRMPTEVVIGALIASLVPRY